MMVVVNMQDLTIRIFESSGYTFLSKRHRHAELKKNGNEGSLREKF